MNTIPTTPGLIEGRKVSGAAVYNVAGENVGEIHDLMIDKSSGRVAYAVMSFGGFLGLGSEYRPIPWGLLHYDTSRDGYVADLSKGDLTTAPGFVGGADLDWNDRDYEDRLHRHFDIGPYWTM